MAQPIAASVKKTWPIWRLASTVGPSSGAEYPGTGVPKISRKRALLVTAHSRYASMARSIAAIGSTTPGAEPPDPLAERPIGSPAAVATARARSM